MGGWSYQVVNSGSWLGGRFDSAFREARAFEGNAQAREQPGNECGDGGVVIGGEMACVAVDLRRDADGDVSNLAHDAISHWAVSCPIDSLRQKRVIICKSASVFWVLFSRGYKKSSEGGLAGGQGGRTRAGDVASVPRFPRSLPLGIICRPAGYKTAISLRSPPTPFLPMSSFKRGCGRWFPYLFHSKESCFRNVVISLEFPAFHGKFEAFSR